MLFLSIALPASASAEAYPGHSGVLGLPDAGTADAGDLSYQFNTFGDINDRFSSVGNHVFTIGVNSLVEVGGRITDWYNRRARRVNGTRTGLRDLSGNIKVRLPLQNQRGVRFAIGANDFAGLANKFTSYYVVADTTLFGMPVSAGYASGESLESLDGLFGSVSRQLGNGFSVHANLGTHLPGLGLQYDTRIGPLRAGFSASTHRDDNDDWRAVVGIKLAASLKNRARVNRSRDVDVASQSNAQGIVGARQALQQIGMRGLRIGRDGQTHVIAFEHTLFTRSYLDAFGEVLSVAARHLDANDTVRIYLARDGIPILALETPIYAYTGYAQGRHSRTYLQRRAKAYWADPEQVARVNWQDDRRTVPAVLEIEPRIRSVVASEFGTHNYSVAIQPTLQVPLPGFGAVVSGYIPIDNSYLYRDNRPFSNLRFERTLHQVALQKSIRFTPNLHTLTSAGYWNLLNLEYGFLRAEALLTDSSGAHQLTFAAAQLSAVEENVADESFVTLGYRRYWQPSGYSIKLVAGQFYDEQTGLKAEFSRSFDEARITAFLNVAASDDVSGGLRLTVPLTPRRSIALGDKLLLQGNPRWSYGLSTTIKDPQFPNNNTVRPTMLFNPAPPVSLESQYFKDGKLTPAHLLANLERLVQ